MEPPSFSTTGPQVVRAAPGSDANLVLPLPSGSPPFHYEWSRAGAKLDDRFKPTDGAGGVRLTISTVSTGDSGVYTLQASNAAGKDTTRVRLEVSPDEKPTGEDPPTFLRRLQDLTVKVGTRTRFLVEIVSSAECRVTWYRNERRLLEAERIALVRDGNFWCADISAVSVDDAGRWTCTAENLGGRASCSAHLNVLVPKAYKRPEFVVELRALLTEQGTVSLECKVVGVPTPVLRWFKDSREIKAGDVFALTANAEDPTSLGTYTCEAVNCMGRAYSSSKVHVIGRSSREGSARPTSGGHVALEPPPIFTKELEDQFLRICEPLTLSCNIVVPPWPRSIVWYNKEGKIEPNEKYRVLEDGVGGYLVEVPSAEWPDEGEWKCVATSSAGRIGITTCYVSMDVPKNYRKPRFMENLQAVLTEEGLVSFECKVVGFPTPVLSWFKDGQELKPGDVYQLTGTNSLGSYCCIARNCMGQASSSAELTVEDIQNQLNEEEKLQLFSKNQAPKFLQGLKSVDAKIDEPFRFTIKVAIPPEPTVLWYRDDQPVDESSRCRLGKEERGVFFLDIQSLEFMDQAEWKCVAMNDFGHSVTSCFLKLIIPRHYKKPRFLENLQAILSDEGAVNLECKVIGVPQPVLKWYKDGEELKPGDIHRIISGQDGTCCLGTYTCEAQNCMGIAASSASLLGFEDSIKTKGKKKEDEQTLQRNLSLSTIHEERTSQMYDTPVGDITLDDKGEISFSFDGKEVSVSLYETPDLTEEEALQIVEMYADQLSENVTEHNVVELPPLRFVKETSTSGNLLMEAIIIDVSPEYFISPEEDLRTEADVEDISIADENGPPQLSLDGEDYLEKNITLLSDEKANFPKKTDRKKSDSQKSADDYFSLSRDQSLSEEKKDDDTQALSESDLQSFASAHSSGKVKSKPSIEDGQESSDITKTVLLKEDLQIMRQQNDIDLVMKNKRERRSRSSRRSSSGSEISLNKMREDVMDSNFANTLVATVLDRDKTTAEINTVNSTLTKLINDVQVIERDIILKSELVPTAATASRSLEIINSLITPLSEIHSIAEAIKESINESVEITTSLFNRLPEPLSILHQSLTIIEKCIDFQRENKTLVKKTCTNIIEKCAGDMNKLVIDINSIVNKDCPFIEDTCVSSIQKTNNEILNTITCSVAAIKEYKEVSEKIDSKLNKITPELKHLQKTQKAVYELRNPLQSLLHIAEAVDMSGSISLENVTNTQIILNDMSAPIQALQTALEQIEFLSVTETQSGFQKYNTEIMETVMDSVIKLRTSFEQLSVEAGTMEDVDVLKKVLVDVKHNINDISTHLDVIEAKIGPFDVLQSENRLEALQKMAQILINLENNLVILDVVPCLKIHMTDFHKNLTKVLEHVIESNEATKYLTFLEICDGINRLNCLIKNIDANDILSLAGISNNLKIIQANVKKNEFTSDLKFSINSNVTDLLVDINETMNHADTSIYTMSSENLDDFSIKYYEEGKLNIVLEQMEKAISTISNVVSLETTKDLDIKQAFNKIIPTLEEIKWCVASLTENVNEQEENISDMSTSTFTQAVANPLCELNHGISVINQIICEKALDYSENEIKVELVTPLLELRNALEILQQDVISQNGENVNSDNIISSAANAVQSVKSCIIMIQEQDLLENLDELSTLEDISAIKTSADIISSDILLSPSVHEITTEIDSQVLTKFETQIVNSVSVQILRNLNDHILILQRPEIVETLDELSKHDEYSSIQSITTGINTIHCAIEDILHPVTLEESQELSYFVSPTQLSAIIQPVQKLHDYLSIIDINNMLIDGIIKTDETKCLSQYLSKLEHCLRDSIDCVHFAIETADVTLETSTQIEKLRRLCVELKDNLDTAKNDNIVDSSELIILDDSLTTVLDTTNCNQEINITRVKLSLERLQQNIASVQDEILGFAVENPVVLHHETKILKSVADIKNTIASLAVLQFVNIGQISDFTFCDSQQVDKEVLNGQSKKIENIVETIENCIQQLPLDMPNNNNLMSVKDFFKTFNDEITLLCCLFNQKPTPKRIIKMLQIFYDLNKNLKQCQLNQEMSGTSADFNVGSATLEEGLQNIRALLLEVLDTQKNLVFNIPISNITNVEIILNEILETNKNASLQHFVKLLMNTIESIKPCINNIHTDIVKELKSSDVILSVDDETDKNFAILYKYLSEKTENKDIEGELDFSAIFRVIQKHADCKHVKGNGKKLMYINCISECLNVLKQMLNDLESKKRVLNAATTSSSDYELNKLLIELSGPFEIFYKKIMNICIENLQITDRSNTLKDLELLELQEEAINIAKVAEKILKCENLVIGSDCSTKTLAKDFVSKIHSIEKSLENLKSAYSVQMIINIEPMKEIEKIISSLLTEEVIREENRQSREISGSLLQHMEQYIEIIEIVEEVSAVIKLDEFKKSADIVRELRDSITSVTYPDIHLDDSELNIREEQIHLVKNLQKALSTLQTDALDCEQELVPHISDDIRQHIIEVVSDLQHDLVALTITPVVLEKLELSESVKPMDQNYISLIQEEESIPSPLKENQNEQLAIINSEGNLEESLNIICTDLTCDFPKIMEIEEIPLHIEASSATNLEVYEEKQSLDLKSDIDLIYSNIQDLSAMKFDQSRELLIHHINDYLCEDILEDIKKVLPGQNFEQLEQSLRIAVEVRDNAVSEDSDPLAQQVFLKKQLELVLNLQEVMLRIHSKNLYDVNHDLLKPLIENKSLLTAKSVIQNLLSSLQLYIDLLNTIIQAEVLTDDIRISKQPCEEVVRNSTIDELKICDENISINEDPAFAIFNENQESVPEFYQETDNNTIFEEANNLNDLEVISKTGSVGNEHVNDESKIDANADKEKSNAVLELESLLQEVNETLHLSQNDPDIQNSDSLQDILQEVQTVILKLKCDFDGSANDTLNENIEDLECNVRSVQLQINENCPPALLKEACANLQTLAACINNVCNTQSIFSKENNALRACKDDAKQTLDLLEEVSFLKVDINLDNIICNLNSIKDAMKYLNSCFMDDAESLILKGIEVLRHLNDIEDKVFALEKELEANNEIDVNFRDSLIAATHSTYGSISNMRGNLCSIQKKYMYDNYGKPTDNFLKSIKNVNVILSYDKKDDWKKFAKSLRTILKHFEDIKFYINFDKTARLPSDSAFTKIILSELRNMLSVVVLQNTKDLDMNLTGQIEDALNYVSVTLNNMENRSTLEVKEKIPIFKELSMQMHDITNKIKILLKKSIDNFNEPSKVNEELSKQEENLEKIPLGYAEYDEKHAQKGEELKKKQEYTEKSDIQNTESHDLSIDINQYINKINTNDQKENEISTLELSIDRIVALQNDNESNEISQDETQDIKNEHLNIDIADQKVEVKLPDTITTDTGNFESAAEEIQNKVEERTILDTPEKNILVRKEEETYFNTGTIEKENVLDVNTMISGSCVPDLGMKHENEISTLESSIDSLVTLQNDNEINEISQDKTRDIKNEHLNIDIVNQEVEMKQPDIITIDTGYFESGSITAADEIQNIVEEISLLDTHEKNILVRKEEETYLNTGTIEKENGVYVNTMISGSSFPDIGMKHENEISTLESSIDSSVTLQNDNEINEISQDNTRDIKNEHLNIDIVDQEVEIKQPDTITTDTGNFESGSITAVNEIQNIVDEISILDTPEKNILVPKEEETYFNTGTIENENGVDVNTMIGGSSFPDIGMKHDNKISTLESSTDSLVTLQNDKEINEIGQDKTQDIKNEHLNIDIVDQEIEIKMPDTVTINTGNIESVSIMAAEEIQNILEQITIFDTPDKSILVSKDEETYDITGIIEKENVLNVNTIISLPDTGMKHATDTMQESVDKQTQKTNLETENVIYEKIATMYPHQYENDNFTFKKQDEESEKIVPDDINTEHDNILSGIGMKNINNNNSPEGSVIIKTENEMTSVETNENNEQFGEDFSSSFLTKQFQVDNLTFGDQKEESENQLHFQIRKPSEINNEDITCYKNIEEDSKIQSKEEVSSNEIEAKVTLTTKNEIETDIQIDRDITSETSNQVASQTNEKVEQTAVSPREVLTSSVLDSVVTESLHIEKVKEEQSSTTAKQLTPEDYKIDTAVPLKQQKCKKNISLDSIQYTEQNYDDIKYIETKINDNTGKTEEIQQYKIHELDSEPKVESFKVEEDSLIETITDTESRKFDDKFAESQEAIASVFENVPSKTEFKDDPKKETSENNSNDIEFSESTDPNIIEMKADDCQANLHKVGAKELDINYMKMSDGEVIEKKNVLKTEHDIINIVKDGRKSQVDITVVEFDKSTPLNTSEECIEDSQKAEYSIIEKMRQSDILINSDILKEVPLSINAPKMEEIAQNLKNETECEMNFPKQQKPEKRKIKHEQCVKSHIKQSESTEKKLEEGTKAKDNELFSKDNEEQYNWKLQKTLMDIENITQEEKINKSEEVEIIREVGGALLNKSMSGDTVKFGDRKEIQKDKLSPKICESKNDEEQDIEVAFTTKEILSEHENVIIDKIVPESKESGSNQSQITKIINKETDNENQLSSGYDQHRDKSFEEHFEEKGTIQSTRTNNNEKILHDEVKEIRSRSKDTVQEEIDSKQLMKKLVIQESFGIETSKELISSIKIGDSTEVTLLGNQSKSGDLKLEKENICVENCKVKRENIEPNIKSESEKADIEIIPNTANKKEIDSDASNQTTDVNTENKDGIALKEKKESMNEEQSQTQEPLDTIENVVMPDTKYKKEDEKPKLKAKKSIKSKDNEERHLKKLEEVNSQFLEKSQKNKSRNDNSELTEQKEEVEHQYGKDMITEENGNIKKPVHSLGEHTKVTGDKNNEQAHSNQQIPEEIFLHAATKEKEASAGLKNREKNDTEQNIPEEILRDEPTKVMEAAYLRDNQQQKIIDEKKRDEHIAIIHKRGKRTLDEEKNTDRNQEDQKSIDAGKNDKEIKLIIREISPVNKSNEFKISKPCESSSDKHISLIEECTGSKKLQKTETDCTEFQVDERHTLAEDYSLHDQSAYYSDELLGSIEDKIANNSADIQLNNILSRKETKLNSQVKKHKEIKQRPSFIDHSVPDYGHEFARPPGYSTKSVYIDNSPMEIKTSSKSPTIYRAQTLIHDSQLKSSLPPNIDKRTNVSEGRTEHKPRLNTTSDLRSTISDIRGSYSRDFKRKPVFSTYLTDRTAVESSRVKLTCSVLSSTDPEISWYKNGVLLDDKHKCRVKYVNGLITLEILNAVPSDSGEYSCTVKNENGSITSAANLKVYPGFEASPIPPTFTRSIRDFYHLHENELVLECRIRGQPLPTITWLKDNRPIVLNDRYEAHYLADGVCRLTILSPNEDDSGKYTCKAENSMWSDKITHEVNFTSKGSLHMRNITTSENIRFTRQATESRRPHFTNVLSDHKVVSGGTIGLQVEICGSPTRVEWLREGRSVTETYSNAQTYIDRGLYTLALSDVTEKESGLYTCRAWSTQGPVEMNASITVVQPNQFDGKPATIISRPVKDLLISVGEDLNISFRAQGEPKPKVFLMKGIRDITNNQRVCKMTSDDYVKFTLKRSVISDAGTYCVFVRNTYGCDRAFVTVVIRQRASSDQLISDWTYPMDDLAISVVDRNYQSVPDRIPSEPSIVDGGNNWVSLAWPKPVSQVKAPILAYKVESWLLGKEGGARWLELGITPRNSFDAFNLKQGEEYHFRVTPRNRYGWGESVQTSTPIGIGLAGDRPEFIEILPGQLKVLVGETATLYCSFKGNPLPDIVWMKNGHEVEEEMDRVIVQLNGSNTSLQMNYIKIEDEGRYSCEATNFHGRSSTYSRMAVIKDRQIWAADAKLKRERSAGANGEYPPQFTMRLRDRRVQATYPVRLTCQVIGSPSPLVTWFKDGEEVSVDSRRTTSKDEYFYTLEIAPTTLDDGGVYEAMARNSSGAISCRCNLVVDKGIRAYIAPEFCCGFEPLYRVCEGNELRISAIVEAYPSVGVTWYRDGVRLRPSRRAIMTLDRDGQIELALASVAARDAGVYTCTASNEVGRASTSGKVEVIKGDQRSETPKVPPIIVSPDLPYSKEPMFLKKPRSSEAREGDTVIIECEVIGDPKPEVYWLRDFLKPDYYRDASHFKRVGAGPAYRFEIPHAKFDYTGAYSIVAKNVHGEAKAIISLQILAKDSTCSDDTHNIRYGRVDVIPRFEKELTDLLCYDGDAIEFECRVSGNPEPDIRWFHYTEVLPECPDFETSYDLGTARLKIKHVTADDEGPYSCEASNNLGKSISSACLVIYPPGEPNTLSQRLRRPPALLSASSTPRSTPRTTPARSLSRTPGPDHRRLCSPSREITPKFYTYPYNRVVEEGDTVVFQCAVKGLPPPWATWDKDGIIITPTARIRIREKDDVFRMLEIEQVTIEDVGLYRVTLENDYGRAEASARLEVISQTGKFYGSRSYSVSPRKCLPYRRRTPSLTRQD